MSVLNIANSGALVVGGKVVNVVAEPTPTNDSFSTAKDTAYNGTVAATSSDSTALTYSEDNPPDFGSVVISSDGSFTYTPQAGYAGADSFTFLVNDQYGNSAIGTMTVTVTGTGTTLAINSVTGSALSATSGDISIDVSKACTIHWRISSGGAVTDKVNDFPNAVEVFSAGEYTYVNGGTLVPSTQYHVNAWLEDEGGETAISSAVGFTTPATSNAAPTNLRWVAGGTQKNLSENKTIGETVGTITADGTPAPTFAEDADPDNKFTVASSGVVTLSADVDFATDPQHTLDVTATNSEGTSAAQTFTIDVIEASGGGADIAATDYTVSSAAALNSLFDGWTVTGGVIQVPDARAVVVALDTSFGGFNIANKSFNHQVTIRGTGTYTSPWNATTKQHNAGPYTGSDMTGNVNLSGCTNVRLYGMYIRGDLDVDNTTDCTIERVWGSGTAFPLTEPSSSGVGTSQFTSVGGSTRLTFKNCYCSYFKVAPIVMQSNTDLTISGMVFDAVRHDCIKNQGGNTTNRVLEDIWSCRTVVRTGSVHTDFFQNQGSGTHTDSVIRRCVSMYHTRENGSDSAYQSFFMAGTNTFTGVTVTQNVTCTQHTAHIKFGGSTTTTGAVCTYNTAVPYPAAGSSSMPSIGGNTKDYNLIVTNPNLGGGSGPNGLAITNLGDIGTSFDFTAFAALDHFSGEPGDSTGFEIFLPSAGASSVAHWDNANPVGAWELLERVFDLGLHPGNVGWPMAEPWERQYNANGSITSGYTGSYDVNGDNV